MSYRKLSSEEISALKENNCISNDWDKISVLDPFEPSKFIDTRFSGEIKLGSFKEPIETVNGEKRSGIFRSEIVNCEIGNNSYVSNSSIVNYKIGKNCNIENCSRIIVNGKTSFGNGTMINVLNEGGGRELKIFDNLTAQIAYFLTLYRDQEEFIEKMNFIIDNYVEEKSSETGIIGDGSILYDCGSIMNVNIGDHTQIHSINKLENGTINSTKEDPAMIGNGVSAQNFIILSGSIVDDSAIITDCFIGQGVRIGKQFSAENSAFFANCDGFHSEACSVFAGPYTVTHHKSTLLIAGLFSFYNAGSGTNQSNHMYKLGPVHQGILERGCKTGSFSYLLWPCRIGLFTSVIGKHYTNFDTSCFPLSFIQEEDGKSVITPGMNLFKVGIKRDTNKWPARDRRKSDKLDIINFTLFSPYMIEKIISAITTLTELYEKTDKKIEYVKFNGVVLKRLLLRTSIKYYKTALKIYTGNIIVSKLGDISALKTTESILNKLKSNDNKYSKSWIDAAGMITTSESIKGFITDIKNGNLISIIDIISEIKKINDEYNDNEWSYFCGFLKEQFDIDINNITAEQLSSLISDWQQNLKKLNTMIINDAEKEFDQIASIGFGIDGNEETRAKDFKAVRGEAENNAFIKSVLQEINDTEKKAENILELLKNN